MFRKLKNTSVLTMAFILSFCISAQAAGVYSVQSGDSLWKISNTNGLTVSQLKQYNSLTFDTIYIGQVLTLAQAVKHTVQNGETLWLIAQKYNSTISKVKSHNALSSDMIYPGQLLFVPSSSGGSTKPAPVLNWPSVTYNVRAGDSVSLVALKFKVSQADIMKFNYMREGEWLNEGQKIAINGYAPRNYAVMPGESLAPSRTGKLVDWFLDGKYLIKRNDVLTITDVGTGLQFKAKVMGGMNHADIEPLTATDTATMKKLFPTWNWTPRAVVIFHSGINFAASLSGMPHSFNTITTNNVTGHFDLYLYNSMGHSADTSASYIKQHQTNVLAAAGMK